MRFEDVEPDIYVEPAEIIFLMKSPTINAVYRKLKAINEKKTAGLDKIPCKLLKCHCNEKIVNPILILKEQHLQIRLNGVFSYSMSCFVSEIFKFLKHAN